MSRPHTPTDTGCVDCRGDAAAGVDVIEEETSALPNKVKQLPYSRYTHSAEVRIDPDFGTVRVSRAVSAVAGGRILNPKTARS